MARIVIYTGYGDFNKPWNANTLSVQGLGGTETAVIYTANELATKGHTVFVVGSNIEPDIVDGVTYSQTDEFFKNNMLVFDTVIGVGYLHFVKLFTDHRAFVFEWVLWQHNVQPYLWYQGEELSDEQRAWSYDTLDGIWVPSEWCKNKCIPPELHHKTVVVPNGINSIEQKPLNLDKYNNIEQLNVVWSSCVSRNLSYVLDVWPTVVSLIPTAKLHVCHPEYSAKISPDLIDRLKSLTASSGVVYYSSVTKSGLYDIMDRSHVWLYPTDYEETFCITALEMISHGVVPCITTGSNLGSFANLLPSTKCNLGEWSDTPGLKRSILQLLIDVYTGDLFNDSSTMLQIVRSSQIVRSDYDWGVIGDHVHNCIKNNYIQKPTKLVERIYLITSDYHAADNQYVPKHAAGRLRKLGISGIATHIVPAIDGRVITPEILSAHNLQLFPWKLDDSDNGWWNRDMTPGEIGCTLSHMWCWYHAHQSGINGILILEDDFDPAQPMHELFNEDSVPSDWDLLYLGRNPLGTDVEFGHETLVKPGYSYNAHAYMLSAKGIENLIQYNFRNKLMPADEILPATYTKHPRPDLSFIWNDVIAYATRSTAGNVKQRNEGSTTQNGLQVEPDLTRVLKSLSIFADRGPIQATQPSQDVTVGVATTADGDVTIYDYFSNNRAWLQKYMCSGVVQKEWELIIDHPIPGVACFNLFKPVFCEEIITLAEQSNKWTTARHDFYPTTDFVLSEIGLGDIYTNILQTYIYPAMKYFYGLEGRMWENMYSEDFVAKYTPNSQAHLSLHHDSADITALVNLSRPTDYIGGGTYFHLYKTTHIGQQGQVTLHPGRVSHRHGGRPVLDGKRYILVSFTNGNR